MGFLKLGYVDVHARSVCHVGFARKLLQWLGSLAFYERSDCGVRTDTSWLELFWSFLHTTSLLPPIAFEGSWRTIDEDENLLFFVPSFKVLFRTWKRILDALLRGGLDLPVGALVACVGSIAILVVGFPALALAASSLSWWGLLMGLPCNFLRPLACVICGSPSF